MPHQQFRKPSNVNSAVVQVQPAQCLGVTGDTEEIEDKLNLTFASLSF